MHRLALLLMTLAVFSAPAMGAETPVLRIAVLKFGTVSWLTDTITDNELDTAAGYGLDVVGLAGQTATAIAFQSGDTDMLVTDWVWALRQREGGADLRFAPYSVQLGALMGLGAVKDLCDLEGRPVGVVGGEFDKSWLVFQALARARCRVELAEATEALFGAPPLMNRQLEAGTVDAVSTYRHWAAKIEAAGGAEVIGVTEAPEALGVEPAPPLIGFVWTAGRADGGTVAAFLNSVSAAQALLATGDAEWERLRPNMQAENDAEFRALRDQFRAGIVDPWTAAHTAAAEQLHRLLIENAGTAYAREAGRFDAGLFVPPADGD